MASHESFFPWSPCQVPKCAHDENHYLIGRLSQCVMSVSHTQLYTVGCITLGAVIVIYPFVLPELGRTLHFLP